MALADYKNKRKITIDHNKFDATEVDYPAMSKFYSDSSVSAWTVSTYAVGDRVTNNNAYYKCTTASTTKEPGVTASWQDDWQWLGDEFDFTKIQSDGKDIIFTASDESTLLDYERELLEIGESGTETYLYDNGDEKSSFTGGWIEGYVEGTYTLTKESTYLNLVANDVPGTNRCTYITNNLIDLTDVDTLSIDLDFVQGHSVFFGVTNNKESDIITDNEAVLTKQYTATDPFGRAIYTLDVSFVSGKYYVGVCANHSTSGATGDTILKVYDIYADTSISYSNASQAVIHARIPSVSSSADTDYYMYYNEPSETFDGENATGVWDSNYVMVQHMGSSLTDSTSNGNDGTNNGSTVVDGLNGTTRSFDGNSYISIANDATLNFGSSNFTLTSVFYGNNTFSDFTKLIAKNDGSTNPRYQVQIMSGNIIRSTLGDGTNTNNSDSSSSLIENNYVSTKRESSENIVYLNNVKTTNTITSVGSTDNTEPLEIGGVGGVGSYIGWIDEVRISNTARSDSWIKADDANLRTWDLQSIGAEEFTGIFATSIVNTSVFGSPSISFDQFVQLIGIDNIQTFGNATLNTTYTIATNSTTNESYIGIPYIFFDQIINGQGFENETLFGELYLRNWKIVSKPTTIWTKKDDEITIWTKQ